MKTKTPLRVVVKYTVCENSDRLVEALFEILLMRWQDAAEKEEKPKEGGT